MPIICLLFKRPAGSGLLNLQTGQLNPKPLLNIQGMLATSGEEGLLGMAFDPNYARNGMFYLNFTVPGGALAMVSRMSHSFTS
jgi:Glucose / Sorbosone dehydrogenase